MTLTLAEAKKRLDVHKDFPRYGEMILHFDTYRSVFKHFKQYPTGVHKGKWIGFNKQAVQKILSTNTVTGREYYDSPITFWMHETENENYWITKQLSLSSEARNFLEWLVRDDVVDDETVL